MENELDHPCYQCICLPTCRTKTLIRCNLLCEWYEDGGAILDLTHNETRKYLPYWFGLEPEI